MLVKGAPDILQKVTLLVLKLEYSRITWSIPGACPTNDISIEFEILPKFAVLWFKMYSTDHHKILHTSQQCNCREVCKIPWRSIKHIFN